MTRREFPTLDVSLRVGGRRLPEYDDDNDDTDAPKTTTKWVEATTGAIFTVHVHLGPGFPYSAEDIEARVKLDGKYATASLIEPSSGHAAHSLEIKGIRSNKTGDWVLERFKFAGLNTDDGAAKASSSLVENVKSLGKIEVSLYRVVKLAPTARQQANSFRSVTDGSISEKCLKGRAISNQTALADPEATAATSFWEVDYPRGRDNPFMTFQFKYRSRRDLQIEGIVPRSPSPVPLEDRDPDDLTPEEARELVRRMRAREDEQVRVKQEKRDHSTMVDDDEDDDDEVTISETRGRKRYRTSHDSGVDTVDLTDD